MVNLLGIAKYIVSVVETIEFLHEKFLLKRNHMCCGQLCKIVGDSKNTDGEIFQGNSFHRRYSIRMNSIFFHSRLPLTVLLSLLYLFSLKTSVTSACKHLEGLVSETTVVQWYNYFMDIMTTYLAWNPSQFNGVINVLHVDEMAIGGKRKYHRGTFRKEPQWLVRIVDKINHIVTVTEATPSVMGFN